MNAAAFKLIGGILGGLALVAAAWLIRDRFHQKALADDAAACAIAAADTADGAALDRCLGTVKLEVQAARRGRLCESSLLPQLRPETRFVMLQACGSGTKRLVAAFDGAAAERDNALTELAKARAQTGAAIARAEARADKLSERTNRGTSIIDAAPRDAGGGIVCDADCLRRLGT